MANAREYLMMTRDRFLVEDRVTRLRAEADRARLVSRLRANQVPRVSSWRVAVAVALFAAGHALVRPPVRDEACADCV
jgi:hypothetical protein